MRIVAYYAKMSEFSCNYYQRGATHMKALSAILCAYAFFMTEATPLHAQPADKQSIQKLNDDWAAAIHTKDVVQLAGMVTDDVVFLPPGYPAIRGRQSVEAMYTSFFAQFIRVEQTASIDEIQVAGEWAFAWGTEKLVLVPKGGGPPIRMQGKGMSIYRRQPDGSWKIARGINNSVPEAAAPKH